jgi:hypothetical protein
MDCEKSTQGSYMKFIIGVFISSLFASHALAQQDVQGVMECSVYESSIFYIDGTNFKNIEKLIGYMSKGERFTLTYSTSKQADSPFLFRFSGDLNKTISNSDKGLSFDKAEQIKAIFKGDRAFNLDGNSKDTDVNASFSSDLIYIKKYNNIIYLQQTIARSGVWTGTFKFGSGSTVGIQALYCNANQRDFSAVINQMNINNPLK